MRYNKTYSERSSKRTKTINNTMAQNEGVDVNKELEEEVKDEELNTDDTPTDDNGEAQE